MPVTSPAPLHPGPRPDAFTFPFAQGRAVLAQLEAEIDDLSACIAEHEGAGAEVCATTEGVSAQAFETWLSTALGRLRFDRAQIVEDADALRARIALAEQQQADRDQAIQSWNRQKSEYDDHQAADAS